MSSQSFEMEPGEAIVVGPYLVTLLQVTRESGDKVAEFRIERIEPDDCDGLEDESEELDRMSKPR